MRQSSKLTTASIIGTAVLLFLLLPIFQAIASDNDAIRQNIKNKVAEHATLNNSQVTIYVEDGFVLLTGSVQLYLQKMEFEQISWNTTGVAEVENEIEVKSEFSLSDTAIERKVRTILVDCKCFYGDNHIVVVRKGSVSVTGVFLHPRDVRFLKRQIAKIEGVIAIDIHATALIAERSKLKK